MTRIAPLALALAVAWTAPAPTSAQTADLAGTWNLSVEVNGNVTTPTLTLAQSADTLTGTYASETLGEARVRGMVDGSDFTVRFNAEMQGQTIPVTYEGTLQEDGTLAGTIELAGGQITGTFTARRGDGVRRPDG